MVGGSGPGQPDRQGLTEQRAAGCFRPTQVLARRPAAALQGQRELEIQALRWAVQHPRAAGAATSCRVAGLCLRGQWCPLVPHPLVPGRP